METTLSTSLTDMEISTSEFSYSNWDFLGSAGKESARVNGHDPLAELNVAIVEKKLTTFVLVSAKTGRKLRFHLTRTVFNALPGSTDEVCYWQFKCSDITYTMLSVSLYNNYLMAKAIVSEAKS